MKLENSPGFAHAALAVGGVLFILAFGLIILETNIHALLLGAVLWVCLVSWHAKHRFQAMKAAMSSGISKGLTAIYIFILIGVLVAAFIASGTIPTLVFYGMDLISPRLFLPATVLICSFMSLATGTSWGTVGTIGVVLIGLGTTFGIPPEVVAGAIVSGAVFGDKMSPISDTTVLASVSAETDLYRHIKAMLISALPAYLLCLVIFLVYGLSMDIASPPPEQIAQLQVTLAENFFISPWTLAPIVCLLILSLRGVAAEITMAASIVLAILLALVLQPIDLSGVLDAIQNGYVSDTGNATIDKLLSRGGLQSVMWTLSLVLIAFSLGGMLDEFAYIRTLMRGVIQRIKRPASLVTLTIFSAFFFNISMGAPYLSIILGGQLFKDAFKSMGFDPSMLSRCVEEGATCTGVLIPWTAGGAFFMAMLDVSAFDYAPWALFNLLNPFISIVMAYLGIGLIRRNLTPQEEVIPEISGKSALK